MLLSHKYQFIFIKTAKTAGTSTEVDLSKFMGKRDVVTPIRPPVSGHEPRNYDRGPASDLQGPSEFRNHMSASLVRDIIGEEIFNSYFKFCVEREPVSKCISHYSMLKNSPYHGEGNSELTWGAYVERGGFPMDVEKYVDADGQLIVDRIVRYESLHDELTEISAKLGFPYSGIKTKAKSGFREALEPTDAQKEKIYEAFAPSLKHCPY